MKNMFLLVLSMISLSNCNAPLTQPQNFEIVTIPVGKGPGSVEVADFNADGWPDLAIANSEDSSMTILLNEGGRKFVQADGSLFYAGNFPHDINIADFNKDGNLDLVIANHERKYITVLLGNGKGQFHTAPHSPFWIRVNPHTHGVVSADFNGDGNLDIGTDSWGVDSIVILQGDGKGDFSDPRFYATGKHPYQRLRTADFNKDHKPDIVTTDLDGNDVTVNQGRMA
jgi:hypothetical protein